MKKVITVFYYAINVILMIISAVFMFLEGRIVFSGDWSLHQNTFISFNQYLIRLLFAIGCFVVGLLSLIKGNKITTLYFSVCILAIAIALAIYVSNGFGLYFIIFAVVYLVINWIFYRVKMIKVKN